jgi:hypothetical protein
VHALRRLHAALVPGGLVVRTQPVSAFAVVEAGGSELGRLDMREWRATIDAAERLTAQTIDDGLFSIEAERHFVVAETADDGPELVAVLHGWQGTKVPDELARRIASAPPPMRVLQDVRLRILRLLPTAGVA